MIWKKLTFCVMLAVLSGCLGFPDHSSWVESSSDQMQESKSGGQSVLVAMDEEEQFKRSDLVCILLAGKKGKVISLGGSLYTLYSVKLERLLKGEETIDEVLLVGGTTDESQVSSSIDERLVEGKRYKIYLKKLEGYYRTVAGYQSIFPLSDLP